MATTRKISASSAIDPALQPGGAAWQVQIPQQSEIAAQNLEDDPEETSADRVLAMLSEAGSDASAKISLYRLPVNGKKLAWLDDMTPDTFESGGLKMIRDKWGAGEYELRLYGIRPTDGRFGVRTRTQISVEASLQSFSQPNNAPSELSAILKSMADQQAEMLRALTERPAPVDPMANMMQMLTMMKLMREATGDTGQSKKTEIGELVAAMRELKQVSSEFNPKTKKDEDENSLLSLASPIIQMVQQSMQAKQNEAQQFPPVSLPQIQAPEPAPIQQSLQTPENQPSESQDVNVLQIIMLRGYLSTLVKMASENKPHKDGSDFIIVKLPDEIVDLMELDNWFELLQQVDASVTPHKEWLTQVRNLAIHDLYESGEPG